jgi:hypothetical protein
MSERITKEDAAYEIDRIVQELDGVLYIMREVHKSGADIGPYLRNLANIAERLRK